MRSSLVTALLMLGCGVELPSPSTVAAPRFIALVTPTPELRPGDDVELEAVFHDPAMRPAVFRWWWCWEEADLDPLRCDPARAAGTIGGSTRRTSIAAGVLVPRGADDRSVIVRVDALVGGERFEGFRRLTLRASGELARPPDFARVTLRQGPVSLALDRAAVYSSESTEVFIEVEALGRSAELTASFLCDSGRFDPPRVVGYSPLASRWSARGEAGVQMWVVLRDRAGGVAVRSFRLTRSP